MNHKAKFRHLFADDAFFHKICKGCMYVTQTSVGTHRMYRTLTKSERIGHEYRSRWSVIDQMTWCLLQLLL